MRVCGLQRLDDSLCLDKWPINQPTNQLPPIHTLSLISWSGLVWSGYMRWWFDLLTRWWISNLRLAARFDARPTHSTLPADILRRTRNPPTTDSMVVVNAILTWLDAARPTHSTWLACYPPHFIDISCYSDQRLSLTLMTTYISNSLEHTTRSFPSLLRLLSFRKLYLLRRAVTIYCDSLRPIRYTPGNFIR
jgi:hypothetical protein